MMTARRNLKRFEGIAQARALETWSSPRVANHLRSNPGGLEASLRLLRLGSASHRIHFITHVRPMKMHPIHFLLCFHNELKSS
jgi:hypothetical protein